MKVTLWVYPLNWQAEDMLNAVVTFDKIYMPNFKKILIDLKKTKKRVSKKKK